MGVAHLGNDHGHCRQTLLAMCAQHCLIAHRISHIATIDFCVCFVIWISGSKVDTELKIFNDMFWNP